MERICTTSTRNTKEKNINFNYIKPTIAAILLQRRQFGSSGDRTTTTSPLKKVWITKHIQFYKGSRGVYHKCANLIFFCTNILITNKNPYMRPLLLQITVWEVEEALKEHETGRPCTIRGPGNELEMCVLRETDPYDHT